MACYLRRSEFISLLCGAAAALPLAAYAQRPNGNRRIGVLIGLENDAETQARVQAFERGLEMLGWAVGHNLRIDYRYAAADAGRMRRFAKELVELSPDLILGHSTPVVTALLQATRTVPIVFVVVSDPMGSGFVANIARPGGNATGFTNLAPTITGKYLSMLKDFMPQVNRVALLYNPNSATSAGSYYLQPFMAAAQSFAVEPIAARVHDAAAIERAMTELSRPHSALIVMPDNFTTFHRDLIISLAARYKLPTIYPYRYFAEAGGLMSYGIDVVDLFRRATSYVDRVLKGEKPGDLPVQAPRKFELVINLKIATALGLRVPRILLAAADVLIE